MDRSTALAAVLDTGKQWDVVVIGGGASGFGAAVDAAARGYRTLLLEQSDFGKATSSRSTKLVHGGVRYLKQGRIALVRESLHERGLLLRNAPHLTRALAFVVPTYSAIDTAFYGMGLKMYEALAGRLGLGSCSVLDPAEVVEALPTVQPNGLRGGIRYFDGQFDDARMLVTLAQTLFDLGGFALNYAPVVQLLKSGGRASGVVVRDLEGGREFHVRCAALINATGAWCDEIRRFDDPVAERIVTLSQGAHIVLDRAFLPGSSALMIPKTSDSRVLFAIPWHGHTLVGTTDVPVEKAPLEPVPVQPEIEFILETAARYLSRAPRKSDILSAWAGLRPLVKRRDASSTAKVSRDFTLDMSPAGMITLAGGKWTTFRRMGEAAIDRAIATAGLPPRPSKTQELPLHGAEPAPQAGAPEHWRVYGSDGPKLSALASEKQLSGSLHPKLPYQSVEVLWAARHECARTVEDVLARRTRALFLNAQAALEASPMVAKILAAELGRPAAWQEEQVRQFRSVAEGYSVAPPQQI